MPALHRFVSDKTPEAFLASQDAYRSVCHGWAVWGRQCFELLRSSDIDMDDLAFTNALPWRTASQAAFGKSIARRAAALYVSPVVAELQPRIIVAVGKRAAEMLELAGLMSPSVVVWNRAQALTPPVMEERKEAASKLLNLLQAS